MPVIGLNVKKIGAIKNENIEGKVFVGQLPKITDVKQRKIEAIDRDGLEVAYEYVFEYKTQDKKKTLASITFQGDALYLPAKEESVEKIVDAWKKEKRIPANIFMFVVNGIMRRSLTRAMLLADELNIPSPIPTPKVRVQKKEKEIDPARYIG